MALAGALLRCGRTPDEVARFIGLVTLAAGGAEEYDQRLAEARSALDRLARGEAIFGFPKLSQLMGSRVAEQASSWLGLTTGPDLLPSKSGPTEVELSEDGIAQLFADRHGNAVSFDHDRGQWFEWTGDRWQQDGTGRVFAKLRSHVREVTDTAGRKLRKSTRRSGFITGVERLVRCDPSVAVRQAVWDADAMLLGTPGLTVDLCSGTERPPNPADRISKHTAVRPDDRAECPRWLHFLHEATGGDVEMIRFLQQWCGYCLTGDTREHALLFIYGPGGNGKSVFLNTVVGILGDYAEIADMETFAETKFARHTTDLAKLRGARLVSASETEEGRAWAESRIKQLTGGDKISARFMRQDFFTFRPEFKLLIAGNHRPVLHNVDDAARRRFNMVPFVNTPAHPDPELETKLHAEWSAILRWMIDGCMDWQACGLLRPQRVVEATESYFSDQDFFGQWLEDSCTVGLGNPHIWESTADLFVSWSGYARTAGEDPGSRKKFFENMAKRGFQPLRTSRERGFSGVHLIRRGASYYDA